MLPNCRTIQRILQKSVWIPIDCTGILRWVWHKGRHNPIEKWYSSHRCWDLGETLGNDTKRVSSCAWCHKICCWTLWNADRINWWGPLPKRKKSFDWVFLKGCNLLPDWGKELLFCFVCLFLTFWTLACLHSTSAVPLTLTNPGKIINEWVGAIQC